MGKIEIDNLRLLEILKVNAIANAREVAHEKWSDDEDEAWKLRILIDKCEEDEATEEEWSDMLERTAR